MYPALHFRHLHMLDEAKHDGCEDVLILAGDQLYRMDYNNLINYHRAKGADVTIATTPADEDHASHLGVLLVSLKKVGGLLLSIFVVQQQRHFGHVVWCISYCH